MSEGKVICETVSGRFIDLANPTVEDIDEEDLAWGLSRMPRYGTHTINELTYTVGQHCIFCVETVQRVFDTGNEGLRASLMTYINKQSPEMQEQMLAIFAEKKAPRLVLLGTLLHDASEAWLLDLPTPLKNLPGIKEAYGRLEARMMELVYEKFGLDKLPPGAQGFINWADGYTLTVEAYHLMRSRGKGWAKLMPVTLRGLQEFKGPRPSIDVYEDFKMWLEELRS